MYIPCVFDGLSPSYHAVKTLQRSPSVMPVKLATDTTHNTFVLLYYKILCIKL